MTCLGCGVAFESRNRSRRYCSFSCGKTHYWSQRDRVADFWALVDKTAPNGCWLFPRGLDKDGYGHFKVRGRQRIAHRLSWEFTKGPIPPGLMVLHRCDNPPCVNPEHLFLGTARDNMADCLSKGRRRIAERHPKARLSPADVLEIRALYHSVGCAELARRFGVSEGAISGAASGRNWKSLR